MSLPAFSVSDVIAIYNLAVTVYKAYKDAPNSCRHISEEVKSLEIILNMAVQYFGSITVTNNDQEGGREVLMGCQSVLEDMNSLIERYNSTSTPQVLRRAQLGTEDIATLRARLISNTGLLNGFIQRFDTIPITIEYLMLIYLSLSCVMHEIREMRVCAAQIQECLHTL